MLDSAETSALARKPSDGSTIVPNTIASIRSSWVLAGASRKRALFVIRVNLAAAEKIGAMSVPRGAAANREVALASAIEHMSNAIGIDASLPELYVERGMLLATAGDGGRGGGGSSWGRQAATDFATALRLDADARRYQPAYHFVEPIVDSS